ncbi:MAG: dienelactone hydrolase family protein, partial [Pirellulaceae bacterium]|nr:dienelactone hydrolase family protein [Pirellulaceae bacterium]
AGWRVLEEDSAEGVRRQLIGYEVEPGVEVQAYLLQPAGKSEARRPGVAVFHSTVNYSIRQPAGIEGQPEKFFGLRLAQRGCVTLCPRNFLWPDNHRIDTRGQMELFQQRHGDSLGMARMLRDSQVAVDLLAALPQVDPRRLGAVGHSLGAKEVLYLAAFDERVRVTVSSEGGVGTRFSNWEAGWYLGPGVQQPDFGHEHHELLALAAPRAFLLLGGDSADGDRSWPFIEAALPIYRLHGGRPRVGLWNHKQGHSVPPEAERAIYDWFEAYL